MKEVIRASFCKCISMVLALTFVTPVNFAQQTRPRRLNDRPNKLQTIPTGGRQLPSGWVLALRLETRLDSGKSQVSDRFTARVQGSVKDVAGNIVLPAESLVTGHVSALTPAQLGRRSGTIEITFDRLQIGAREYAISGELTSADEDERQKLDSDGHINGSEGSNTKRNVAFIGGGTATGAIIGVIAGSALIGAGVGAAAGATAALLAKGKEAVVEPGTIIGVRLSNPLDLNQPILNNAGNAPNQTPSTTPNQQAPVVTPPAQPVRDWQPVNLSFVKAERTSDGKVLVLVTTTTRTGGWQVRADYKITSDTLEIWAIGLAPEGMAAQVISHPTFTLSIPDNPPTIRYVIVHGANGDQRPALKNAPGS